MIRGVACVIAQTHASELWADDDEVLRQTGVQQEAARLTGVCARRQRLIRVDEVREPADVAVREEGVCGGRSPERLRRRQSTRTHDSDSGKIDTTKDPVHQRNIVLA